MIDHANGNKIVTESNYFACLCGVILRRIQKWQNEIIMKC